MELTKRQAGVGIVSLVSGGSIVSLLSTPASGASISGEFNIPDKDKSVQGPVSGVHLDVTGTAAWESETRPTKAVIRLELKKNTNFEQLTAKAFTADLKKDHTQEFELEGNILKHSRLTAADFSPNTTGESVEIELTGKLKLDVRANGRVLDTAELTDDLVITVTKTVGDTTVELGAKGSVSMQESD